MARLETKEAVGVMEEAECPEMPADEGRNIADWWLVTMAVVEIVDVEIQLEIKRVTGQDAIKQVETVPEELVGVKEVTVVKEETG